MDFKLIIAESLISTGRDRYKKVIGRPKKNSNTSQTKKKYKAKAELPSQPTKLDKVDHFPDYHSIDEKGKCRHCHIHTNIVYCKKCNVKLCFVKNRNCFFNFHHD